MFQPIAVTALVLCTCVGVITGLLFFRKHWLVILKWLYRLPLVSHSGNGILTLAEKLGRAGESIRKFKDERLEDFVGRWCPIPANGLTLIRGLIAIIFFDVFFSGNLNAARTAFLAGWITDLFDGLKARYEAKHAKALARQFRRSGDYASAREAMYKSLHARWWGKRLDPLMDMPWLIGLGFILAPMIQPAWLSITFSWLIILRVALYLAYWQFFRHRIRQGILPRTVEGQYKTVFVVMAYALVLFDPTRTAVWKIPEGLIAVATILEPISLGKQIKLVFAPRSQSLRQPVPVRAKSAATS